jgi:cardiolipin synthase C
MTRQHARARFVIVALTCLFWALPAAAETSFDVIRDQIAAHPGKTGAFVLDTGEEALIARAWLADHAERSIEVQYFIWSTDNVGILASEALLRAAERGVKVRVIVDDLLIDAPDKYLLALAKHPNVDIRIYNPKHRVGTPLHKRIYNVVTNFRGVNQRMHDKTMIVDGIVGITGGRNMADEYFSYDHDYNFRDRDALLLGEAVKTMGANFEAFWSSPFAAPVETLYDGFGLMQKSVSVSDDEIQKIYSDLHAYASSPENFSPEVRATIAAAPKSFDRVNAEMTWGDAEFIHDIPGKNDSSFSLGGGGRTTARLAKLVAEAQMEIVIQSPYLVMSSKARNLFKQALARGVRVRINTNSLASTDNLQAFSGYRNQRKQLQKMGIEIFEFKPDPANRQKLTSRAGVLENPPVFALHAKTMVIDGEITYIGTFNLDPRSENLNTEVGVIVRDSIFARRVQTAIEEDMLPANSWSAREEADKYVPLTKRGRVRLWQLLPIKPIL